MKKRYVFLACAVPLAIWLIVPFIIKYPLFIFSHLIDSCKDINSDGCGKAIAILGQSGDIYGISSSLFSGLALFAVAATLWADHSARRKSLKPLLICSVDKIKEISFDDPNFHTPRNFRIRASIEVKAANETALNTVLNLQFKVGSLTLKFKEEYIEVPLSSGQSSIHELYLRLNEAQLAQLIGEINLHHSPELLVTAICDSMEGISWATDVTYKMTVRPEHMEMIRALSRPTGTALDWPHDAAVGIIYEVVPNSWKHRAS